MTIPNLVSKSARGMNEHLLKTSGADVLSPREKKKKKKKKNPIKGWYPPPPALYVRGLTQPSLVFVSYVANDHDDGEHKDDNGNEDFYEGDYPI